MTSAVLSECTLCVRGGLAPWPLTLRDFTAFIDDFCLHEQVLHRRRARTYDGPASAILRYFGEVGAARLKRSFLVGDSSGSHPTKKYRLMPRQGRIAMAEYRRVMTDAHLLEVNITDAVGFSRIGQRSLFPHQLRPPLLLAP
jgi:hypothetical protein